MRGQRWASASMTSLPVTAPTVAKFCEAIDLDAVDSKGYCFQIDLTWRTINSGFVVAEVPITFTERELGVSKMSGSNIREALVKVTRWGVRGGAPGTRDGNRS